MGQLAPNMSLCVWSRNVPWELGLPSFPKFRSQVFFLHSSAAVSCCASPFVRGAHSGTIPQHPPLPRTPWRILSASGSCPAMPRTHPKHTSKKKNSPKFPQKKRGKQKEPKKRISDQKSTSHKNAQVKAAKTDAPAKNVTGLLKTSIFRRKKSGACGAAFFLFEVM